MLDYLQEEHRALERLLHALCTAAEYLSRGKTVDMDLFCRGIDLLQNYAEDTHQKYEEEVLFPLLESEGVSRHGGPIEVLLAEHQQARKYMEEIMRDLDRIRNGEEDAKDELIVAIKSYSLLLKAHIGKEDMVILPLARHAFDEKITFELKQIGDEARKVKVEKGALESFLQIVTQMEKNLDLHPPRDNYGEHQLKKEDPDHLAEEFLQRNPE